jgi:hypothetical protein
MVAPGYFSSCRCYFTIPESRDEYGYVAILVSTLSLLAADQSHFFSNADWEQPSLEGAPQYKRYEDFFYSAYHSFWKHLVLDAVFYLTVARPRLWGGGMLVLTSSPEYAYLLVLRAKPP